jgi:hypothetical protein
VAEMTTRSRLHLVNLTRPQHPFEEGETADDNTGKIRGIVQTARKIAVVSTTGFAFTRERSKVRFLVRPPFKARIY